MIEFTKELIKRRQDDIEKFIKCYNDVVNRSNSAPGLKHYISFINNTYKKVRINNFIPYNWKRTIYSEEFSIAIYTYRDKVAWCIGNTNCLDNYPRRIRYNGITYTIRRIAIMDSNEDSYNNIGALSIWYPPYLVIFKDGSVFDTLNSLLAYCDSIRIVDLSGIKVLDSFGLLNIFFGCNNLEYVIIDESLSIDYNLGIRLYYISDYSLFDTNIDIVES